MQTPLSSLQLISKSPISKEEHKKLKNILQSLLTNNDSIEFRSPVDWKGTEIVDILALNLLDYVEVVKHPMDLGTISHNLDNAGYYFVEDVLDHIQLVWDNCKLYNPRTSWISNLADKLQRSFKKMVKNYLPHMAVTIPGRNSQLPQTLQSKKISNTTPASLQNQTQEKDQMPSVQDKQILADKLKCLNAYQLGYIVEKVMQKYPSMFKDNGDNAELIFDIMDWECYQQIRGMADGQVQDIVCKKIKQ